MNTESDLLRRAAIVLHGIAALFFAFFLGYTLVARSHLEGLAREFVTEKTREYSQSVVDLAEQSLRSPLVQRLFSDEELAAVSQEIESYRHDPSAYLAELTGKGGPIRRASRSAEVLEKVAAVKGQIRTYYGQTLASLIRDLRIFSAANLLAGVLTLGLAYRSRGRDQRWNLALSVLMLGAVLYSAYLYIDGLSFFRILFRAHLGWWYPVSLGILLGGIWVQYGRAKQTEPVRHTTESIAAPASPQDTTPAR